MRRPGIRPRPDRVVRLAVPGTTLRAQNQKAGHLRVLETAAAMNSRMLLPISEDRRDEFTTGTTSRYRYFPRSITEVGSMGSSRRDHQSEDLVRRHPDNSLSENAVLTGPCPSVIRPGFRLTGIVSVRPIWAVCAGLEDGKSFWLNPE
jgi:hypothetical protein